MRWTLSVVQVPASNDVLLLVGIYLNPCHFGGGGSLLFLQRSNNTIILTWLTGGAPQICSTLSLTL